MDFIIGILLVIVLLLVLYNFTSISISNKPNAGMCNNSQQTQITPSSVSTSLTASNPSAVVSKQNNSSKVSLNSQEIYDYKKYFFVS